MSVEDLKKKSLEIRREILNTGFLCGEPVHFGGVEGRMEATGRGVQFGLQEFFRHPDDLAVANLDGALANKKIIVQGLGNVGYHAAKFLQLEDGAKIIAVLERDGAIINNQGLDIEEVSNFKLEHGKVEGFPGASFIKNGSEVLEHPCDILIPAAMEGVITQENAPRIQAKVIAEAANGPVTYEADQILNERGIFIIPDAYLNAGGVTVSYFEWLKNLSHVRFGRMDRRFVEAQGQKIIEAIESGIGKDLHQSAKDKLLTGPEEVDLVRSGLEDTMTTAYAEIKEQYLSYDKINDRRTASYSLAIRKIADIYESMYL